MTCWSHFSCSPGNDLLSQVQAHIPGSCPIFYPPISPSPSPQDCSESILRPVCIETSIQVKDLVPGHVEFHEVHMGPSRSLWVPSLQRINSATQLGVTCKTPEDAFNATVYVINKDIKKAVSVWTPEENHLLLISIWTLSH